MENNDWRTTNDEFRGYVRAKLEYIADEINKLCKDSIKTDLRLDVIEKNEAGRMAVNKKMAAIFGTCVAVVSAVLSVIVNLVWGK